jgi:hypothetical protein
MTLIDSRDLKPLGPGTLQASPEPAVVLHDRLEGAPRADNFDRALRAEVRDATWMLSCQLRSGEFHGDDAGSPAFATVNMATARLRRYRAAGAQQAQPLNDDTPLEAIVERRPIPFKQGTIEVSLDLRLLMGRQWLKLAASVGDFSEKLIAHYPVTNAATTGEADAPVSAHWEAKCMFDAVAGRRLDGMKLYERLTANPPGHVDVDIPALAAHASALRPLEQKFVAWFQRVFYQPSVGDSEDAWRPSRMEYEFSCAAPWIGGEKVLTADEYYHGHLDWYNLDIDASGLSATREAGDPPLPDGELQTLIPVPVSFDGMPNPRWWSFEDRRTNFGEVKPHTTDIAKLLFIEFGLQYSNDWSVIPYTMPQGSLAKLRGMAVTSVFGDRIWIEAAGSQRNEAWQKWGLFVLDGRAKTNLPSEAMVVLLPTPAKVQEGRPLEKVFMVRDEMSNMVWGIEESIALPTGETKPGIEAAREMVSHLQAKIPAATPPDPKGEVRYQLMNTVPENWIPFVPIHIPNSIRDVQLQRAAMLRIFKGDQREPQPVRPRTSLLRTNLDAQKCPHTFFVAEEEVPRSGTTVTMSFNRTRWHDGTVWTWLGMRKQTGRGERTSGLAFDQILPVEPKKASP